MSGEAGAGDSWTGVVRCPAPFTRVGSANLKCRAGQVQYSTVQYSTVQYSTVQYIIVQYSTVQYSVEAVCAVERGLARVRGVGGLRGRAAGRGGARLEDAAPEDQVTHPSQDTWPVKLETKVFLKIREDFTIMEKASTYYK